MAGDEFATRFAERVLAARWPVILTTVLLVALASGGIARLEFSANYRIFFDEDNPGASGSGSAGEHLREEREHRRS